jgi:DNA (cytosine-5)-methyltransferase 1
MRHGSLFSGIGGFDLASQWMGWENIFHCEWMEFPRKVLEYHFPESDSLIDICKTDFKKYANTIDILTGGFPCQPFSTAGKRKGTDDERYLWGEMLRAIQEIKPKYVIAENVFGITNIDGGLVFEQVCLDLEAEGYEVQPFIIPAASKNAPHRRDRVWFIAQNTNCIGLHNGKVDTRRRRNRKLEPTSNKWQVNKTHWDVTNSECNGLEHGEKSSCIGKSKRKTRVSITGHTTTESWSRFPTQSPICGGDDGIPTQLDGITFSKWRAESIKGYGNAIVPQVAFELFKIICNIEK